MFAINQQLIYVRRLLLIEFKLDLLTELSLYPVRAPDAHWPPTSEAQLLERHRKRIKHLFTVCRLEYKSKLNCRGKVYMLMGPNQSEAEGWPICSLNGLIASNVPILSPSLCQVIYLSKASRPIASLVEQEKFN